MPMLAWGCECHTDRAWVQIMRHHYHYSVQVDILQTPMMVHIARIQEKRFDIYELNIHFCMFMSNNKHSI